MELLEKVKSVAQAAGREIMPFFQRPDLKVFEKDDHSPITLADRASNRIICESLEHLTPEIPIISEENALIPFPERKAYSYSWLVDPLDGTREFVAGNPDFTVNIALLKGSYPLLGVVYVPALDAVVRSGIWVLSGSTMEWYKNCMLPLSTLQSRAFGCFVPVPI